MSSRGMKLTDQTQFRQIRFFVLYWSYRESSSGPMCHPLSRQGRNVIWYHKNDYYNNIFNQVNDVILHY